MCKDQVRNTGVAYDPSCATMAGGLGVGASPRSPAEMLKQTAKQYRAEAKALRQQVETSIQYSMQRAEQLDEAARQAEQALISLANAGLSMAAQERA